MAKVVGVFNTAHSPFCYMPPEQWNEVRAKRSLREDVPMDDLEENQRKSARIQNAFSTLKSKIKEVNPDVLVVFGDDQLECFDFNNFPGMAVYVGEEYEGHTSGRDSLARDVGFGGGGHGAPKAKVMNHPDLAVGILTGLMQHGFDPAFCMDMPKPDRGLAGGVIRTAEELTDWSLPIVPVMMNLYFAPQPTGMRCYQLGKAVRQVIDEFPGDLRVGVVGSGGLWHTPGMKDAWLNEEFDQETLAHLQAGDILGMAEHFDSYVVPPDDASQYIGERGRNVTGMPGPGGPQGGTRETCAWIGAAAVADGCATTIVDYIAAYASPVGNAFAYCDRVD